MRVVPFDGGFAGWRDAARTLLAGRVAPTQIVWRPADDAQEMLFSTDETRVVPGTQPRLPKAYFPLAEAAACYRDPERWALLYRVAWRLLHGERHLLDVVVDPDVRRLVMMERAVRRDVHKMKAFVRFRKVAAGVNAVNAVSDVSDVHTDQYVAWFEPAHDIVERVAPFFVHRFTSMDWTILTPHRSIHWDRSSLTIGAGVSRDAAPEGDELEGLWRTYYASIFNPARLKLTAMRAEMPKKYWKGLPEASLIPELVASAPARVRGMIRR